MMFTEHEYWSIIQTTDLINGSFELAGGLLMAADCRKLYADKGIKGVYWPARAFFAAWGLWNLFYYPSLHQELSFLGGAVLVAANLVWVALALYYMHMRQPEDVFRSRHADDCDCPVCLGPLYPAE